MANFKDTRINQTYQRLVQVDGAILQDGKGNTISGSMGDLTVSGSLNIIGHTNVSASLSRLDSFSSSIDDIYATDVDVTAVSSRVTSLENFSSSLDATYATDEQLDIVSQSLSLETAQLLDFSASLDATFATDLQLSTAVSALNASTSSLAHKNAISGAFSITSASLANKIASLDSEYASDTQLTNLSSSAANTYLSKAGKIILSSSAQLFEVCDPRYGFTPYDARYANSGSFTALSGSFLQLSSSLQSDYILSSSFALLSSSLQDDFLGEGEWQIASASLRNDISYDSARVSALESKTLLSSSTQIFNIADSRYGFTSYDARYANINSITGSFAIESSRIDSLESVVSSSALLNLTPSATLPTNVNTGSLAVTGSTLAFYDGNNWKVVITGSTLPL
ncbi:hypothetical protein N9H35_00680 [bacterium]|nr:hypothetical protein [bacterium]